jgi:hypothetical protein
MTTCGGERPRGGGGLVFDRRRGTTAQKQIGIGAGKVDQWRRGKRRRAGNNIVGRGGGVRLAAGRGEEGGR